MLTGRNQALVTPEKSLRNGTWIQPPSKQYTVLDNVEGDIGRAHYYAVKADISKDDKPIYAYVNMRVKFFDWRYGVPKAC